MDVYIEVTYILNALIIFLSFEILSFLCNIRISKKEMFKYVLTFNISVLLIYVDVFEGFLLFYDLVLCIYFFRKQTYIYYPIFIFVYISLISFCDFLSDMMIFQCILVIDGLHLSSLFFVFLICLISFYFYIYYCSILLNHNDFVDVYINDHQYIGFIDSGNKVYYKGYPLIFFNKSLFYKYRAIDSIEIKTAVSKGIVDIIEIDEMMINHQSIHHLYAGLIDELEYDCILNTKLMGGII